MLLNKELTIVKEGIKCYLVSKSIYIKLGVLYDAIKTFNSNKYYYNLKKTLNIKNKIFKNIDYLNAIYYTHDVMTYNQGINLTKRIITRLFNYDYFYYNQRYVNKEECLILKYYILVELFSQRLYSNITFTTHIKLATYLFNLNYSNHAFNDYIMNLDNDDLEYLLDYNKKL